jgi:hypothetical protein
MPAVERVLAVAVNGLVLVVLAGLLTRRRARLCLSFSLYLATVAVTGILILVRPDRFFVWSFYLNKEFALHVLKLLVVLELTARIFQAFPAARRTAIRMLLVIVGVTAVAVAMAPVGDAFRDPDHDARAAGLMASLQPRIANGTAWLFGSVFALILYYRIPLHPFHRAIAFGFMPYLLMATVLFDLLRRYDFGIARYLSYVDGLSYLLLLVYWARAAWRRDPPPPVPREVVDRLQPWRREGTSPDL